MSWDCESMLSNLMQYLGPSLTAHEYIVQMKKSAVFPATEILFSRKGKTSIAVIKDSDMIVEIRDKLWKAISELKDL